MRGEKVPARKKKAKWKGDGKESKESPFVFPIFLRLETLFLLLLFLLLASGGVAILLRQGREGREGEKE